MNELQTQYHHQRLKTLLKRRRLETMCGQTIIAGAEYVYLSNLPVGCEGHRYKVHRFILDVPSYQQKVLVEALSGNDKGLWFACSPANFVRRYKLDKLPPDYVEQSRPLVQERS